jgi:sugar/nucleoside kinase (ribokinase family)
MTRDTGDSFMMIGLHKLAAERGYGLIPELLALYRAARSTEESPRDAAPAATVSTTHPGNDNVIPFRPRLGARHGR